MTKMRMAHATIWPLPMALAQSVGSSRLLAQDTPATALPPLIEEAEEMALALSAAPAHVSGEAALATTCPASAAMLYNNYLGTAGSCSTCRI